MREHWYVRVCIVCVQCNVHRLLKCEYLYCVNVYCSDRALAT